MVIGDVIVHKNEGLCRLDEITHMNRNGEDTTYYVFVPYYTAINSNKTMIPADKIGQRTRDAMSKDEALEIINALSTYKPVWDDNNKTRRANFEATILEGDAKEVSKIIYMIKNKENELKGSKKTISKFDGEALSRAQKMLFSELAYVLEKSIDEIKEIYNFSKNQ